MHTGRVYLNGRIVAAAKAAVPVFDRGLCYGDGLFETMKAVNGRVEFCKDHLDRLARGAEVLGIPKARLAPFLKDIRAGAVERLLKANGLSTQAACVKIIVTRGQSAKARPVLPVGVGAPTVVMTAVALDTRSTARLRKQGVRAVTVTGLATAVPGVKTLNYLPNVLARMEAKKRGAGEAIFTGPGGDLLEATGANLFIVEGGVLKTPPVVENPYHAGVLPGVMRKAVIELAVRLGINVMGARVTREDVERCSEAFLTNSVTGIIPLLSIDSATIGNGVPGPVVRRLQGHL